MDVLLLLLGTVIGSVGSVAGSVIVGRRELTRNARIRIYRDLLPPLLALAGQPSSQALIEREHFEKLYRESVLAGRTERRRVEQLKDPWLATHSFKLEFQPGPRAGSRTPTAESTAQLKVVREHLSRALLEFQALIERKIR